LNLISIATITLSVIVAPKSPDIEMPDAIARSHIPKGQLQIGLKPQQFGQQLATTMR